MRRTAPDMVERIVRELQERAGNLTAAEAARLARRSKSRIRHLFTSTIGMSFRKARLRARLAEGRILLLEARLTILEISANLDYSDRSKFARACKRVYHMTPTQYRLMHPDD